MSPHTEFDKIKGELEEYGLIMQACIEEAAKTLQIWRGTEIMTASDDENYVAMMPTISVALFEKVTRSAELPDDIKLMIREISFQSFVKFIAKYDPHKIDAVIKSSREDEGEEP